MPATIFADALTVSFRAASRGDVAELADRHASQPTVHPAKDAKGLHAFSGHAQPKSLTAAVPQLDSLDSGRALIVVQSFLSEGKLSAGNAGTLLANRDRLRHRETFRGNAAVTLGG
jgi:hypothetical protein